MKRIESGMWNLKASPNGLAVRIGRFGGTDLTVSAGQRRWGKCAAPASRAACLPNNEIAEDGRAGAQTGIVAAGLTNDLDWLRNSSAPLISLPTIRCFNNFQNIS